jgi:hypothetical protein
MGLSDVAENVWSRSLTQVVFRRKLSRWSHLSVVLTPATPEPTLRGLVEERWPGCQQRVVVCWAYRGAALVPAANEQEQAVFQPTAVTRWWAGCRRPQAELVAAYIVQNAVGWRLSLVLIWGQPPLALVQDARRCNLPHARKTQGAWSDPAAGGAMGGCCRIGAAAPHYAGRPQPATHFLISRPAGAPVSAQPARSGGPRRRNELRRGCCVGRRRQLRFRVIPTATPTQLVSPRLISTLWSAAVFWWWWHTLVVPLETAAAYAFDQQGAALPGLPHQHWCPAAERGAGGNGRSHRSAPVWWSASMASR